MVLLQRAADSKKKNLRIKKTNKTKKEFNYTVLWINLHLGTIQILSISFQISSNRFLITTICGRTESDGQNCLMSHHFTFTSMMTSH